MQLGKFTGWQNVLIIIIKALFKTEGPISSKVREEDAGINR